uniref:CSON006662 protein n=1 Tax=Culicoides sonorensis TaxID=179676 RepID=A0A336MV51_CULSO
MNSQKLDALHAKSPAPSPDPDIDDGSSRRQATRVFKKSSSNGKITVYLGKRDFVDHLTHVDPIVQIH